MMLLSAPHSAEKFSAPISGLRSLLVVPDADAAAAAGGTSGGSVVTRAAVAAHGCDHREDVNERRDDGTSLGHGEDVETAKEEDEEENDNNMEVKEREDTRPEEEEDELDGFWVSYGRRCPRRRRLPPPIPSLVARGALRRTRTDDGRLVIRIVPVVRPECIRARLRRDRLVVVEHEDGSPMVPPPPPRELTMTAAREDGVRINVARADDDVATPAAGEGAVHDVEDAVAASAPAETLPEVPPPRVPSLGCFEEVFKLGSIGSSSSLHQMASLRMVH